MRTKVNIGPARKTDPLPEEQLRSRVAAKQKASKTYTDVKRGARVPKIKEGSLVRVRKPFHVKKGLSKFQRPTRVIRKAGSSAFVLEDGRTWNATHLSLVPESETNRGADPEPVSCPAPSPVTESAQQPVDAGVMDRPMRVRREPAWLKEYEH